MRNLQRTSTHIIDGWTSRRTAFGTGGCTRGRKGWGRNCLECVRLSAKRCRHNGRGCKSNACRVYPVPYRAHRKKRARRTQTLTSDGGSCETWANGKTIQLHQPASCSYSTSLPDFYPNNPDILDQHPSALSDCNNGATLTRTWAVHTHLFHRICEIGEADGDAPV